VIAEPLGPFSKLILEILFRDAPTAALRKRERALGLIPIRRVFKIRARTPREEGTWRAAGRAMAKLVFRGPGAVGLGALQR